MILVRGSAREATLRPFGAKCGFLILIPGTSRGHCVATSGLRVSFRIGRGWPVGPLAASSNGGDIAADQTAARPVQVLYDLRPARRLANETPCLHFRCPPDC